MLRKTTAAPALFPAQAGNRNHPKNSVRTRPSGAPRGLRCDSQGLPIIISGFDVCAPSLISAGHDVTRGIVSAKCSEASAIASEHTLMVKRRMRSNLLRARCLGEALAVARSGVGFSFRPLASAEV